MKKYLLALLIGIGIFSANAQDNNKIIIGKIDSLHSAILNEPRKLMIYNPGDFSGNLFSKQQYPVIYLLDGDAHFHSVVGMVTQLSENGLMPQMIVVAIPNTNRTRDLTPTKSQPDPPFMPAEMAAETGGGDKFLSFIEKELFPYIDKTYPTAPYRMFIGHSLGGLMVMDALLHHQGMFNSYVSIDPSMWYDKQDMLRKSEVALKNESFAGTSLYLAMANTMERSMDIATVSADTSVSSAHIRSIMKLTDLLVATKENNLKSAWKYYPDDSHGSVPLIAEYDAFRFLFKDYFLNLTADDFTNPAADVSAMLKKHYDNVSGLLGYTVNPPENMVNMMGYQMLQMNMLDKAEALFKSNTINYPNSGNTFDSLGDLYVAKNQSQKAAECFQKALSINEVPDTRRKLDLILQKKK